MISDKENSFLGVISRALTDRWMLVAGLMVLVSGCGKEVGGGRPNEPRPEGMDPFDASVGDGGDAAPEADCADVGPYELNNSFSPFFGGEVSVDAEVAHFSSLYCIHCAEFSEATRYLWESRPEYRDRVRIYFRHADYVFRHRAAVAAQNQGMAYFWSLHDFIYDRMLDNDSPSDNEILKFVETELKLDMARFNRDLVSDETYAFLVWEIESAIGAGVNATPTAFVCGHELASWHLLEMAVDDQIQ